MIALKVDIFHYGCTRPVAYNVIKPTDLTGEMGLDNSSCTFVLNRSGPGDFFM